MSQILTNEFKSLEQKVTVIINNVFAESQNNIRKYIQEQEEEWAGELIQMKANLIKEQERVEMERNKEYAKLHRQALDVNEERRQQYYEHLHNLHLQN